MMYTAWRRALCAVTLAAAVAAPASAAPLTFFDAAPAGTLLAAGDSYQEAGFTFTTEQGFGVIDTPAAFGPGTGLDLAAPRGNTSQFLTVLNDGVVKMRATSGGVFSLSGFSFGFVAALTQLFVPGERVGGLLAFYETAGGTIDVMGWDFGVADANGEFNFQQLGRADMGALAQGVRQIDFAACTFDVTGSCTLQNGNFNQFAIDNFVPEPGSLALAMLALGLMGGLRARRTL